MKAKNVSFFLKEPYYIKKIDVYLKDNNSFNIDLNNFEIWINFNITTQRYFFRNNKNNFKKKIRP